MSVRPDEELVGFEVTAGVALLELRRPDKRNAVNLQMWHSIAGHLSDAAERPDVQVLIVQGSGGSFSAGADLSGMKSDDSEVSATLVAAATATVEALAEFPAPSIARVEGYCIGGGVSIALACDMRIASPDSVFAIPAVRHGIVYDQGSLRRLVELIGPGRAARMIYTTEQHDGPQAAALGLVDQCADDLDHAVDCLADAIKQGHAPTVRAMRRIIRGFPALKEI